MFFRNAARPLLLFVFLASPFLHAKDKEKNKNKVLLPDYVLQAHTVLVIVDPDARLSLENPNGNRNAREDVERAIMRWGRFDLALNSTDADLVIFIQKGTGKLVGPTIGGIPVDPRPGVGQSEGGTTRIGGQTPPPSMDDPNSRGPRPGAEINQTEDTFEVYRSDGQFSNADVIPSGTPAWRYVSMDGLRAPSVRAVEEFRKAIEKAEEAKKQQTKPTP